MSSGSQGRAMSGAAVRVLAACVLAALAACQQAGSSAQNARPFWLKHDPASTAAVDHSAWDRFVSRYVLRDPQGDGVNRVDYRTVSRADRERLKAYIRALEGVDIAAYNRDEQVAFWMNLYNAAIADLVLDNLPVGSIRQIRGPGIGVAGPWLRPVARVQGATLTFDDIEHRILRPAFNDMGIPIHYGLNCASVGCPALAPRAHTGANWRANLEETARQFVNCPQGVRFVDGELRTSKIYLSWFREDFGGSDESVIAHIAEYAEPELARRLAERDAIAGDFYDWRLNGAE